MSLSKHWIAIVLLGGLLAAGGCEDDAGSGPSAGNTSAASIPAGSTASDSAPAGATPQASSVPLLPGSLLPTPAAVASPLIPGASQSAAADGSPAGSSLTVEKAISIGKYLHGNNGEVQWSAEFQRDVDIEGVKRNMWRVEALFPAGNKWWYWLDAENGKMLSMTELEAPGMEQRAALAFRPYLTETEGGLRLAWDESIDPNITIMQTLESPEANKLAVHLVRRLAYVKGREQFLLDAVIVDPLSKTLRSVPLANASLGTDAGSDSYTASSFAQAHGFADGERLILTVPVNRPEGLQYDVLSLQIRTGETAVLVKGAMPNPAPDWLTAGWLDPRKNILYLNLFQSGELWEANLKTGQARKAEASFPHRWPLLSLFPSRDGERFVYLSKEGVLGLYTADGKQLAVLPGKEGFYSRPPAAWSPDGRFLALETTPDKSDSSIFSWGEDGFNTIAPTRVLLFDRNGNRLGEARSAPGEPNSRIECAGWLEDGSAAVVHTYKLERNGDIAVRTLPGYSLMDTADGHMTVLAKADRIEELEQPEAIFGENDGRLVFIDRSSPRYVAQGKEFSQTGDGEQLILVSAPGEEPIRWTTPFKANAFLLNSYYPSTKKTVQTRLPGNGMYPMSIGPDIVYDSSMGYLLLE